MIQLQTYSLNTFEQRTRHDDNRLDTSGGDEKGSGVEALYCADARASFYVLALHIFLSLKIDLGVDLGIVVGDQLLLNACLVRSRLLSSSLTTNPLHKQIVSAHL